MRETSQFVRATIGELEARASDKIANGTWDQHFTRVSQCGNSRRKMYGYALRFLAANFTLTRMQSGPDANARIPGAIENLPGMRSANQRPSSTLMSRSPVRCITIVGT